MPSIFSLLPSPASYVNPYNDSEGYDSTWGAEVVRSGHRVLMCSSSTGVGGLSGMGRYEYEYEYGEASDCMRDIRAVCVS